MLKKILIANRGEIACRIVRTAKRMGIATVAVYSDADAKALHVEQADEAVHIGASPATESYLRIDKIIAAAKQTGADAIHPGYGFLSENAELPEACVKAGITFIGPSAAAMRALGGKAAAKDLAIKAGVPVVPGYQGAAQDLRTLSSEAKRIGYPVMIKAVAGGGGRGMRLVESEAQFSEMLDSARREAASAFANDHVLIEKVVQRPRHVEVQVFGDRHGNVVHMFERDCSLQRRNQKVIEEAPAPGMSEGLRAKMCDAAVNLAKSVGYEGAGTVEFLVEGGALTPDAPWYFIEMNTRLQVEHPVTEEITGLDLVEWQFRVAAGEKLPLAQSAIKMSGHAIEVRLCAEDPAKGFLPSVGRIEVFEHQAFRKGTRLETGIRQGDSVSPYYDSMIAKLIAYGKDRETTVELATGDLAKLLVGGVRTNARFLINLLALQSVRRAVMDTGLIAREIVSLCDQSVSEIAISRGAQALIVHQTGTSQYSDQDRAPNAWSENDGYQLGGAATRRTAIAVDGIERTFELTWVPEHAIPDGHWHPKLTFSCWPELNQGAADGPLPIRARDGAVFVFDRGASVVMTRPTYDITALDDAPNSGAVRAPINGRVAKIFVKPGDAVERGAKIAVVEAMKMEHVLVAAVTGVIDKIATPEGAQVVQGALVASIAVSQMP